MSVNLYDKALGDKIKSWVLDPKLTILYPGETTRLFNQVADNNKDKITLPLIALSRDRNIELLLKNRRYAQQQGRTFNATRNQADHLRHIPIRLKYQIDIYTRYREEADDYLRNFVFNIIDFPTLEIEIPYNDSGLKQKAFIELNETLQDNSDIPESIVPGQFTRVTLSIELKDAQLFSYDATAIPKITDVTIKGQKAKNSPKIPDHSIDDDCEILG